MLVSILNICTEEELGDDSNFDTDDGGETPTSSPTTVAPISTSSVSSSDDIEAKRLALRNKVIAIGRVSRMYLVLRQESEDIALLKLMNSGTLPKGSPDYQVV